MQSITFLQGMFYSILKLIGVRKFSFINNKLAFFVKLNPLCPVSVTLKYPNAEIC